MNNLFLDEDIKIAGDKPSLSVKMNLNNPTTAKSSGEESNRRAKQWGKIVALEFLKDVSENSAGEPFDFDMIIGMDNRNIEDLREKAPSIEAMRKIFRMTDFSRNKLYDYVPDPYYSGADGFELVLDLLEDACAGLLEALISSSNQDS